MASAVTHFSRKPAVKGRFGGISDSTIYNWVKAELITKPIRLGPNTACWLDAEIEAISAARVAGKTDAEIRQLVRQLHAQRELVGA